jgi:hypothetical protein
MWIMTQHGFYSVVAADKVHYPESRGDLVVRARSRVDLEFVLQYLRSIEPEYDIPIIETPNRDYECRIVLTRGEWNAFMLYESEEIDYHNFKSRVMQTQGIDRESVYMSVWSALQQISRPIRRWLRSDSVTPGRRTSTYVEPPKGFGSEKCSRCRQLTFKEYLDEEGLCPTCQAEPVDDADDAEFERLMQMSDEDFDEYMRRHG